MDDRRDLDLARREVVIRTLKRRRGPVPRTVPLPSEVVAEFGRLLAEWPELKGSLFKRHRTTVYLVFQTRAAEAGLAPELRHPHVLRHTKAIELLRAGGSCIGGAADPGSCEPSDDGPLSQVHGG